MSEKKMEMEKHQSLQPKSVEVMVRVRAHDFVEVKPGSKANDNILFVRNNRELFVFEPSDGKYSLVRNISDFFPESIRNPNYPWTVYGESKVVIRTEKGIESYRWTNGNLTHENTVSRYHDHSGYGSPNNTFLLGQIYPSERYIGVVTRLKSDVQFRSIDLNSKDFAVKSLKKAPNLVEAWTSPSSIISLIGNVDNSTQRVILLRTESELKLFRFDGTYELKELANVPEFPPFDDEFDKIVFANFDPSPFNDLLHFSTNGLQVYRYNGSDASFQKLYYSTAFSKLRGWDKRTVETVSTLDVDGDTFEELLFTGPSGVNILRVTNSTSAGFEFSHILSAPECDESVRYSLVKFARNVTSPDGVELFIHTPDGLASVKTNPIDVAKSKPNDVVDTLEPTKKTEPITLPTIFANHYHTRWLHDQVDLTTLLQPINPHTGAVELILPVLDITATFGSPIKKIIQYNNADYDNELGRGWSFPLDYIILDRQESAFEQDHVYSLVKDNQRIILMRELEKNSPSDDVSFKIDGYPDVGIVFRPKKNNWVVSIDKRTMTYSAIKQFHTDESCALWPLCGDHSKTKQSYTTRWYLTLEQITGTGMSTDFFYDVIKNGTDIRLVSIGSYDTSTIELKYKDDRITELMVYAPQYEQHLNFRYSKDNRHLVAITQKNRNVFEFEYDHLHRLSKIVYPNGIVWTPAYKEVSLNPSSLKNLIPTEHDTTVFYGPDYVVVVDANLTDGRLKLHIVDPLGGSSSSKTGAKETVYALSDIKRYVVHALESLIVVVIIYDSCKDIAIYQFNEDDEWEEQKYYEDFPLKGTVTAGNKFVLLSDLKTLRLITTTKDRRLSEVQIRKKLPDNFVVKAFPHGYATYDGAMEIHLLHESGNWTKIVPRKQSINYFNEINHFVSSYDISNDLAQSIRTGLQADMLGIYRQALVLKAPVLKNGQLDIHARFFILNLHNKPTVAELYTTIVPYADMNTFKYTVRTEDQNVFTLAYRWQNNKYHLRVKNSTGPHLRALNQKLANANAMRANFANNHKAFKSYINKTTIAVKREAIRIYKSVKESVIFALDLSQFGMLTNSEGVLTGNHQITYDGLHWNKRRLDDDTIRLHRVNRNLNNRFRLVKAHVKDTFKIVSIADGITVFDTNTTLPEKLQLVMPYYAQAQPKEGPIRVFFFESNRTVTMPDREKLNRASNQVSLISSLEANETFQSLVFRSVKYFLNPNITVLGKQTLTYPGEEARTTEYIFDAQDARVSVDGTIFQKLKIAPGANRPRFGWYEQSVDLQTGDTVRKAFDAFGTEVMDPKLREQEEKRRQSEREQDAQRGELEHMILDENGRHCILDLGPYRLVDEMVSYYGFQDYEVNRFGKNNKWIFAPGLVEAEKNNKFLMLAQPTDKITAKFTPVDTRSTFVVSCWMRSPKALNNRATVDILTVDVVVDGKNMSSNSADIKQRIGEWNYVESSLDTTDFPLESKLHFVVTIAPSKTHPWIDVDHVRFSPLGMAFAAHIYEPITPEASAVLGSNGLMRRYFYNPKGKKTIVLSDRGMVQEFTMESKVMYTRESGRKPCVVEMSPRKSAWLLPTTMDDIEEPIDSFSKKIDETFKTLALRLLYTQYSQNQCSKFTWQNEEFQLPCKDVTSSRCPTMPPNGEILIFITDKRISFWIDGVLIEEQLLKEATEQTERLFKVQFAHETEIREFIVMYDPTVKVTYHNLAGQPTQVLEYEDSDTVRVREILYDDIERPFLQTKWTKVHIEKGHQFFAFRDDFIKSFNHPFNHTLNLTGEVSDLNPACEGFPFSHTVYNHDPTENKHTQGLPGKDFTVEGKYKRSYSTQPHSKMLGGLFPVDEGFHHKNVIHPGGAVRVTVENTRGKKVARFLKVGNYENRLTTWRYGTSNKVEQELPPMFHSAANSTMIVGEAFFDAKLKPAQVALAKQWEVRYDYDEAKRIVRKRTPDGGVYRYLYDKYGILRFTLHKDHNETLDRVIHFSYLSNDKITREALVQLNETQCSSLINDEKMPESADYIQTVHGELDRDPNMRFRSKLSTRRINDDQMTEFIVYNDNEKVLSKAFFVNTINTSYSIDYEYDNDKLRSIKYPIGAGATPYRFIYDHNGHGDVSSIREATRKDPMFEFTYNADGMMETMVVRTDESHKFQRNFTYNEPGFLVKLQDDYLTEEVSYLETDSYGQDSYTPIYEGLISKTSFTAHWVRNTSPLRNGIYPEYFITTGMNRKRATLCHDVLKRAGYLDENNLVNRTFYGEREDELPFVCGRLIPMNHLSEVLSSKSFPHEYGHRYDYDDHDQLIKAKYFHGLDELKLSPLTHLTFSKEVKEEISEANSTEIWDKLRENKFLTLDCTNPNLCHGRAGRNSIFIDYINQHRFSQHLKTALLKAIADRKTLKADDFENKCKRWIEGSNMIMKTCTDLKESLRKQNIVGDGVDNPLNSLQEAFKTALAKYKNKIPDIVRVLGHHFTTALGRSAGDVQSYEIDANGNHRKFYTGFSRYRLEYHDGTNKIRLLHRLFFDRDQRSEDHFSMVHNSDGAVVKAEHKGIQHMEYDKILHRVTKIEMTDGRKLLFQYDVRAERTFKQVLDKDGKVMSEKYYIRDANGLVLVDMDMTYLAKDQPPDVRVTSYIYKDQQLVGFVRNDKLYGVITDHEGSVRLVVRDGEVVAAYDYLPYGQIFRRFGTDLDGQISYLYTSQEWEPETGLYNYRARLYDPDIGRFYQMDPKEQYPSPYVYAGNSPVALIDPDGELAFAISCIILAIVGAYLGAASAAQSWNPLQWNWKSKSLWLGLIGGALSGLAIPFNMSASVTYFVGLGLSMTTSIAIMIGSGITFGYFALAAASGSWDPRKFDFSSPAIWNALLGGIGTAAFIVTNPSSLIKTFRSITSMVGRAIFVTLNVSLTVTFAYLFGVMKMGGEFDMRKWDFKDPGLYLTMLDAYVTVSFTSSIARNIPHTVKKWNKKISAGLDRVAEVQTFFRARRLMHGDWSSKLSNARYFMSLNTKAIADLHRGAIPMVFYTFIVTLRMADSYERSPVPGFSLFLDVLRTVVMTRGFSNRVVKQLIPSRPNAPLSFQRRDQQMVDVNASHSTFPYVTSGAETLRTGAAFLRLLRLTVEWFQLEGNQQEPTIPRDTKLGSREPHNKRQTKPSKHGTINNCYRVSKDGDGYYVSCYSHRSVVSIYPKDDALLESHDGYRNCLPLTYDGVPGISCDGDQSTILALQLEPPTAFQYLDSWLLLARVAPAALREGKRILRHLFGGKTSSNPEAREPREKRTHYRDTLQKDLAELQALSTRAVTGGCRMDWFTPALEDLREDVDEYLTSGRGTGDLLLERLQAMRSDVVEEMELRQISSSFGKLPEMNKHFGVNTLNQVPLEGLVAGNVKSGCCSEITNLGASF